MVNKMHRVNPYIIAVLSVFAATVLTQLLYPLLSSVAFTLFYAAIAITTWVGGAKPGLFTVFLSLLVSDYFFRHPDHSLVITEPDDLARLSLIASVSLLINYFISELRGARYQIKQLSDRRLQKSEEQLRLALQAAHMGMWDWNMITGEITWTPEHEQLLGMATGTFDGRYETFDARLHPDDREGLNQTVQAAIYGHSSYKHEYRIIWADGSTHWVEGRGQTFYDGTGKPIRMTGTLMDIDDRKRMEIALKQSEQQFRAIFEAEPECVKIVTADGILQTMNPAGLAMLEADYLEQVQGHCVCPLIEPTHQKAFLEFTQEVAQGKTATFEFEITGLQGTRRRLESHAVPLQSPDDANSLVLSVTRDITERKRAEEALRLSEERYRSLVEATTDSVWLTDAQGNVLKTAPLWTNLTGQLLDENSEWDYLKTIHPDDRDRMVQVYSHCLATGEPYEIEYRVLSQSGECYWLAAKAVPVYDYDGSIREWIGTFNNITERRTAETILLQSKLELEQRVAERTAELQRTNNLLNNFFSAASLARIGLCIHDQNLRFVQINEALAAINGYSVADHLGKTTTELLPELAATVNPLHEQVLTTGQPIIDLEITTELPNQPGVMRYWLASYFPISSSGSDAQTVGVGVIVTEISDRKRAEAVLVEADRRWRSLLDNVQLVVVGLNQNGNIEYVNPFFLQLTGYAEEEVLGQHWFDQFLTPGQKPSVQVCFQELLEKDFHPHYQNSIVTKLGEERIIAWSNTLLRNAEGKPIGTISIGEDITERHKLEQMKAEFISIVSHELRTPLTSINGALELLSTGLIQPESDRGQETIGIAAAEADRLTRLVNDILDLERLESGKIRLERQPWDLAQLMTRAVDFMQLTASQMDITLLVEPLPVTLDIDGDRILQVLTNLLSNAVKFSPNHSTVWLTAETLEEITVEAHEGVIVGISSAHLSTSCVRITVRDQGRGIPANNLESIFERFQQVDASDSRKKGGTGLGLAICRSIVQQHDGTIWAESLLEQGSRFHFTLPLTTQA
ncbi:PAS domain S-box protein [Leptolyngbya sp. CCNP1308]|uniref:PAS domain S-box protein n=1 Tax=Leptolyngbya sp. CCNP1308 TaxID=3110255 RepID=UPI002B206BF4|nr:PAS domain S-box protein [Leptolyngbya sp. CCNP1308]MEA5452411.1 PAS domain S-box protein [Leptolyngbya sp. CCNP1308]